jgi:hypothetical protein
MKPVELSGELLWKVKMGGDVAGLVTALGELNEANMVSGLPAQEDRLVFWLNLYNAFFQLAVKDDPRLFSKKIRLFTHRRFTVAGHMISLDDIEHNMLRRSAYKWGLGYLHKPFPSAFEKMSRVFRVDPRVHFAMNCGAKSCPPVRFYDPLHLEEQLEMATRSFLTQEVTYDEASRTVHATRLFSWFRGDFGGISGVKEFLHKYAFIPSVNVRLKFTRYNWEEAFENYA